MLLHPVAAKIDCHTCQLWEFDFKTGERAIAGKSDYHKIIRYCRKSKPLAQCGDCPKKSPERAEQLKLTDEQHEIIDLFFECRAMQWQGTPEAVLQCRILRRLFTSLEIVYREVERQREEASLIYSLSMARRNSG